MGESRRATAGRVDAGAYKDETAKHVVMKARDVVGAPNFLPYAVRVGVIIGHVLPAVSDSQLHPLFPIFRAKCRFALWSGL